MAPDVAQFRLCPILCGACGKPIDAMEMPWVEFRARLPDLEFELFRVNLEDDSARCATCNPASAPSANLVSWRERTHVPPGITLGHITLTGEPWYMHPGTNGEYRLEWYLVLAQGRPPAEWTTPRIRLAPGEGELTLLAVGWGFHLNCISAWLRYC